MEELNLVWIACSAFGGGILSAVLGWLEAQEAFSPRKFGRSCAFAVVSALTFAVLYQFADGIGIRDIFFAILGGAGVDALSNRALGALKS